jgi:hypothetical protein
MTNAQIQALSTAIAIAVATALNSKKQTTHKAVSTYKPASKFIAKGNTSGFSDRQLKNDVAVAKAFKKQGFLVTPRVDCLTYKGWLSKGMRVQAGQRGIFVKGVGTLFHSGQVKKDQPISLVTGQPVVQAVA